MREEEFLREYEKLCKKYKMGLEGCGCCGSPYLNTIYDINYNDKLDKIFIGGDGFWHERELEEHIIDDFNLKYLEKEKSIDDYFKE